MKSERVVHGEIRQYTTPDWTALEEMVGYELLSWFMWMCEIELSGGARVHAYKHKWTRRYLHLTGDGRAFQYTATGRYREVDPYAALVSVLDEWDRCSSLTTSEEAAVREALERARGRGPRPGSAPDSDGRHDETIPVLRVPDSDEPEEVSG
jgi:hypothetical protein